MKVFEVREFSLEGLQPAERPAPEPGPGQVLVTWRAWSLNYRDLMVVTGQYNPRMPLPRIPLSDGVGEVTAVGAGVERVRPGDRVAGIFLQDWLAGDVSQTSGRSDLGGHVDGLLAECSVLSERGVVHVPEHLSDEEAASLPCAAVTAWHALAAGDGLKPGQTVLLLGTGGVSIFALQFSRLFGAQVVITSSSNEKLRRARELGASFGINYREDPDWHRQVLDLTGGIGVDLVVEVGGAGTLGQSLRCVRRGGRISLIGVLSGTGDFNPLPVIMRSVELRGIYVGSRALFEEMNRAIALHKLRPVVDRVFDFDQAPEALRYLQRGAHFGKVCIRA